MHHNFVQKKKERKPSVIWLLTSNVGRKINKNSIKHTNTAFGFITRFYLSFNFVYYYYFFFAYLVVIMSWDLRDISARRRNQRNVYNLIIHTQPKFKFYWDVITDVYYVYFYFLFFNNSTKLWNYTIYTTV